MDGVINLDKPRGITSQDAVTLVKRRLGVKKAGHAGTLDPMATGVLLVCVGEATKISSHLMGLRKSYLATLKFGERTDTYDAEGRVIERVDGVLLTADDVLRAASGFTGDIKQIPPMYSAIKQAGQPLYKLARKGVEVKREPRSVSIYSITLEAFEFPFATIKVDCSTGTYIRSLADDMGRSLGSVAHLSALRRLAIGSFTHEQSIPPDGLSIANLLRTDDAISHMPEVVLREDHYLRASHGGPLPAAAYPAIGEGEYLRLKSPDGALFAIARVRGGGIIVERILHLGPQT